MTGIDIDDIAPPSGDAWKPEVGDLAKGVIVYAGKTTGDSFDRTKVEEKLRIDLEQDDGSIVTIWATTNTDVEGGGWAKRDAKAIAAAVRAAGQSRLELRATLAIKRIADVATERGAAKAFQAEYQAPPVADLAPVGGDAGDGAVTGLI